MDKFLIVLILKQHFENCHCKNCHNRKRGFCSCLLCNLMRVMDKFPIWSRLASVTDDHVRRLGKDWVFYCEKDSTGCVTLIIILELLQLFVCLFVLPSLDWPFWWIPSRENRAWKCTIELQPKRRAIITKTTFNAFV